MSREKTVRLCKKCLIVKELSLFTINKNCKLGYEHCCKECSKNRKLLWNSNNLDKRKIIIKKHYNEKGKIRQKNYYNTNKQTIIKRIKEYSIKNSEIIKYKHKIWNSNNRDKINKTRKQYFLKKPWLKIWRTTLNSSITRMKKLKTEKTFKLLKYTSLELKQHLEKQFDNNMNWENYSTYWVVDHIKPVSKFNPETLISEVCALDNLQPLEKITNLKKYNKYE